MTWVVRKEAEGLEFLIAAWGRMGGFFLDL